MPPMDTEDHAAAQELSAFSWSRQTHGNLAIALSSVGLVTWLVIWAICILGLYTARKIYSERPRSKLADLPPEDVPGVSIIRPLRGLDPNLFNNLASTLCLEYPKERYEVLFCVQTATDQAVDVVKELLSKYSELDARVVVAKEGEELGVNPKINNLREGFAQAKWDIVWVLDATISVSPGTLARSVEALTTASASMSTDSPHHHDTAAENAALLDKAQSTNVSEEQPDDRPEWSAEASGVGLIHHVPLAWVPDKSFGAQLEMAYLNSTHAKMYLAINATSLESCVVGKSNLYRKSSIAQLHAPFPPSRADAARSLPIGLAAFAPYLPEDNLIALAIMHQLKLDHRITPDLALDCLGQIDVRAYIARRVRWIRVRRRMTPLAATLAEPFTESLLLGAIASASANVLFGFPPWLSFALHEAAWLGLDLSVMAALKGEGLCGGEWAEFLVAWACRETLALPIWLMAMMGETVSWRGVRYKILRSGEAVRL